MQRRLPLGPWLYIIVLVIIVAVAQRQNGPVQIQTPADGGGDIVAPANAVRIADGDSIDVGRLRMRLDGIDAPELVQQCSDASGRAYDCGQKSAQALADLVRDKPIDCVRHGVDQFGRILAVCSAGGVDVNAAMVDSGNAVAYRGDYLAYVPNEERAKAAKKGLWAGSFEMPRDYRRDAGRRPQ
jgi:endonuclease YncB( thermonuclease family)